jgi:nucleotide-binding universal stress UspA family protein
MLRIRNILCPLDFTPSSLRAFDYGLRFAKTYDASLHLLHVIPPVAPSAADFYVDAKEIIANLNDQASDQMRRLRREASDAGIETTHSVQFGEIRAEIAEAVKKRRIDLVILGKQGVGRIERWFMGSTAEGLLRRLPVPMLIISERKKRTPIPSQIRRIAIATDFSKEALYAVSYGVALAQDAHAKVTLLHVRPKVHEGFVLGFEKPVGEVQAEFNHLVSDEIRTPGRLTRRVESGVPYKRILDFTTRARPDLLVIGVHGNSRMERVLLGSTAERVIRGALCPVLVVPPKNAKVSKGTRPRAA